MRPRPSLFVSCIFSLFLSFVSSSPSALSPRYPFSVLLSVSSSLSSSSNSTFTLFESHQHQHLHATIPFVSSSSSSLTSSSSSSSLSSSLSLTSLSFLTSPSKSSFRLFTQYICSLSEGAIIVSISSATYIVLDNTTRWISDVFTERYLLGFSSIGVNDPTDACSPGNIPDASHRFLSMHAFCQNHTLTTTRAPIMFIADNFCFSFLLFEFRGQKFFVDFVNTTTLAPSAAFLSPRVNDNHIYHPLLARPIYNVSGLASVYPFYYQNQTTNLTASDFLQFRIGPAICTRQLYFNASATCADAKEGSILFNPVVMSVYVVIDGTARHIPSPTDYARLINQSLAPLALLHQPNGYDIIDWGQLCTPNGWPMPGSFVLPFALFMYNSSYYMFDYLMSSSRSSSYIQYSAVASSFLSSIPIYPITSSSLFPTSTIVARRLLLPLSLYRFNTDASLVPIVNSTFFDSLLLGPTIPSLSPSMATATTTATIVKQVPFAVTASFNKPVALMNVTVNEPVVVMTDVTCADASSTASARSAFAVPTSIVPALSLLLGNVTVISQMYSVVPLVNSTCNVTYSASSSTVALNTSEPLLLTFPSQSAVRILFDPCSLSSSSSSSSLTTCATGCSIQNGRAMCVIPCNNASAYAAVSPVRVPVLLAIYFAPNKDSTLYMTFSLPCTASSSSSSNISVACSSIFDFASLSKLGSPSSICRWLNASTLSIFLSNDATLGVNDTVTVLSGVCTYAPTPVVTTSANALLYNECASPRYLGVKVLAVGSALPKPVSTFCSSYLSLVYRFTSGSTSSSLYPVVVSPSTFPQACSANNTRAVSPLSVARSITYTCLTSAFATNISTTLFSSSRSAAAAGCQLDLALSSQMLYCDVHSNWISYQLNVLCDDATTSPLAGSIAQLQSNSQNYLFVASFRVFNIASLPPLSSSGFPSPSSTSSSSLSVESIVTQYILFILNLPSTTTALFTIQLTLFTQTDTSTSANTIATNTTLTTVTVHFAQSSSSFPLYYGLQAQFTNNNSLLYLTSLGSAVQPNSASFSYSFVVFVENLTTLPFSVVLIVSVIILVVLLSLVVIHRRYYPRSSVSLLCLCLLSLLNAVSSAGYLSAAYAYSISASHTALQSLCMYAMTASLASVTVNVVTAVYCVTCEHVAAGSKNVQNRRFDFAAYVHDNVAMVSAIMILSSVDLSNIMLLSSRIFYLDKFSAHLSERTLSIIAIVSCITSLGLNSSTFLISLYMCTLSVPNTFTVAVLVVSGLNVTGKCVRLYLYILDRLTQRRSAGAGARGAEAIVELSINRASAPIPSGVSTATKHAKLTDAQRKLIEETDRVIADAEAARRAVLRTIEMENYENPLAECVQ